MLAAQLLFYAGWHKVIRQTPKIFPASDDAAHRAKQKEAVVDEQLQTMKQHFVLPKVQCPMQKEHVKRSWDVWASADPVQHLGDQKWFKEEYCIGGTRNVHKSAAACSGCKTLGPTIYGHPHGFLESDMGEVLMQRYESLVGQATIEIKASKMECTNCSLPQCTFCKARHGEICTQ